MMGMMDMVREFCLAKTTLLRKYNCIATCRYEMRLVVFYVYAA